jgi:hypothetical protein
MAFVGVFVPQCLGTHRELVLGVDAHYSGGHMGEGSAAAPPG